MLLIIFLVIYLADDKQKIPYLSSFSKFMVAFQ
jgi:hypothetical protein